MDLFSTTPIQDLPGTPLAEKLRPKKWADLLGQPKVLAQIERYVRSKFLPSLIFWGPPGTGKTSLAQSLAQQFSAEFIPINAVESGAKALKEIGEGARNRRQQFQQQTILFVDEIHRFNKGQQDILLPFIEKGDLILIGATTENPSYELNRALMSRCRLIVFQRHDLNSLSQLLIKACEARSEKQGHTVAEVLTDEARDYLLNWCDGDARRMLLGMEEVFSFRDSLNQESADQGALDRQSSTVVPATSRSELETLLGQTPMGYDKQSDQHYDVVSAFIKSIRGSDADAGIYYLARMLKGGEDPIFIARRLVILASEDVGNADPRALQVAISGLQALELIGMPEGAICLAQVVTYLASAPKSNRSYLAIKKAQQFVETTGTADLRLALRSAKTVEMKKLGYGEGYLYPHDFPKNWVKQDYWPEGLEAQVFYEPGDVGFEKQIKEYLKWQKS